MSQLLNNIQNGIETLKHNRVHVMGLINSLRTESRISKDHPDPQSYHECWGFLEEKVKDLYNTIEELESIAGFNPDEII